MERGGTPPRLDAGPLWLLFTDEARPAAEASGGRGLLLLLLGAPPGVLEPAGLDAAVSGPATTPLRV